MKKLISILFLSALLAVSVSAQKSVEELNGYDWVTLSDESRVSIIRGFYISCTQVLYMTYEINKANGMAEEKLNGVMKELEYKFVYSETTVDMAKKLDNYFASPSNRKFFLYRTIPFLAGKEWWNRTTGEVEPTNSSYKDGA